MPASTRQVAGSFGGERSGLSAEETERLFDLVTRVNAGSTVEEILDTVFEEFTDVLPYDRVEFAVLEDRGRRLRTHWVRTDYQPVLLGLDYVVSRDAPFFGEVDEALPFVENDLQRYAAERPGDHPAWTLVAEGIRSALSCPLVVRGEVIGVLFFAATRSGIYREQHLRLIRHIANHLAAALEQSRLRAELEAKYEDLRRLSDRRNEFIASVSHEMRSPLAGVVGLSAALRDGLEGMDPSEVEELVSMIASESAEVAGIVEDLLAAARSDSGEMDVRLESLDLREQAEQVLSSLFGSRRPEVEGRSTVIADPLRVRQIVRNLVTNPSPWGNAAPGVGLVSWRLG